LTLSAAVANKIWLFQKSKMAGNRLTDFDYIWHADKILQFQKSKMSAAAISEIEKSQYLSFG